MKLCISAFALAFGVWWGGGVFLMTWWLMGTGGAAGVPLLLDRLYLGYNVTPLGSVIGLAYGLVCGVICGGILAWLYNLFAQRLAVSAERPHRNAI